MQLFHIDESGNTGANLDAPDQPIHWLVALCVTPDAVREFEREMLALALKYFPERAREPDFEFHGNHIYTRRGDCRGWPAERAVELYAELMGIVARQSCAIFITGIDKAALKRRAAVSGYDPAHPYSLAFMYLLERVDDWLEHRPRGGNLGLVADEQKEVDRHIVKKFASWRHGSTEYGVGRRSIRFLIDTVHYVPSHDSWLIQMADCLAYLYARYQKVIREKGDARESYTPAEAAVVKLWEENCAKKLRKQYLWPAQGKREARSGQT